MFSIFSTRLSSILFLYILFPQINFPHFKKSDLYRVAKHYHAKIFRYISLCIITACFFLALHDKQRNKFNYDATQRMPLKDVFPITVKCNLQRYSSLTSDLRPYRLSKIVQPVSNTYHRDDDLNLKPGHNS